MNQVRQEELTKFFQSCLLEYENFEALEDELVSQGDDVDQIFFERNKHLLSELRRKQEIYKKQVHLALERLERGHFGECFECGSEILEERLIACPEAINCISCQETLENAGGRPLSA